MFFAGLTVVDRHYSRFPQDDSGVQAKGWADRPADCIFPDIIGRFIAAALDYEAPDRAVAVSRRKIHNPALEKFFQSAPSTAATPVSRMLLFLALTGARLSEALAMKWADVDFQRNRLTVHSAKTGRTRIVPLAGAPEGLIAPRFAELLRVWHRQDSEREFILPHGDLPAPSFPKSAWQAVNALAKVDRIGPQMLRQSFVSYCASMGVPSAVAALWTGHSASVAERWYRQQVLDRVQAATIEAAMGLEPLINRMVRELSASIEEI